MAVNKRKLLASAQKHLSKGSLDKALRDYTTILEADPRDANVRLKVGDLHLRRGDREQAVAAYRKVADKFMRDGFDAKAVALYKQITKIDPKRFDVYVPLAELYQRLGLTGDAMSALQTAADAMHRDGRKREALELLRRMASLDPSNTTTRLKVAELLRQAGLEAEAAAEYEEAANELARQGDWESQIAVLERLVELLPEHAGALEGLARTLTERGRADRAESFARRLVAAAGDRPQSHEVLAAALAALDRKEEAITAYRALADLYRARGDEDRARDILQRHVPSEAVDLGSAEAGAEPEEFLELGAEAPLETAAPAVLETPEEIAAPEPATPAEPAPLAADPAEAAIADGRYLEETDPGSAPVPEPSAPPAPAPGAAATLPDDADPDQVVAEATVYLRYGKHERAIATLEAVLARTPEHAGALERLGQAYAGAGDAVRAVSAYVRAADLASQAGAATRFDALHARIAELDPEAAEEIATLAPRAPGEAAVADDPLALDDIDVEIEGVDAEPAAADAGAPDAEIELDLDAGDLAAPAPDEAAAGHAGDAGASDALDELLESTSFSDATGFGEVPGVAAEPEPALDAEPGPDLDVGAAFEPYAEPQPDSERAAAAGSAACAEAPEAGPSADELQRMEEEIEEARFYLEQGLLDEAEAIYQSVLRCQPDHAEATRRLAEIEQVRAGAPAGAEEPASGGAEPPATDAARALTEALGPPDDLDAAFETQPGLAPPPDAAPDPMARTVADLGGAHFGGDPHADLSSPSQTVAVPGGVGGPAEAAPAPDGDGAAESDALFEDTAPEIIPEPPQAPRVEPEGGSADAAFAGADEAAVPGSMDAEDGQAIAGEAEPAEAEEGGSFDLAAALSGVFDDAGAPASEEEAFDAIFQEFKQGVSRTLDEGDVETRYDLGIAYREMGLFEDAISEFSHLLGSGERRLDALHMLALCALDLDRSRDAVAHLEQALASDGLGPEREVPLRYDLGRAYERQGDAGRARDAFRRVAAMDPDFQDVASCLRRLEGRATPRATPASDDDVAETYESFDDLIADEERETVLAEAELVEDDADDTAESVRVAMPMAEEVVAGEEAPDVEPSGARIPSAAEPVHASTTAVPEPDAAASAVPGGSPADDVLAALEAEDARAERDAASAAAPGGLEDTEPELPAGFDSDALTSQFEGMADADPEPDEAPEIVLEDVTDSGAALAPGLHRDEALEDGPAEAAPEPPPVAEPEPTCVAAPPAPAAPSASGPAEAAGAPDPEIPSAAPAPPVDETPAPDPAPAAPRRRKRKISFV